MPGSLDLLLLDPVLDGLGVDQLLELVLLSDQKMVLMSGSLGRNSVVSWGNILSVNNSHGEPGRRLGQLALLVELGLGGVGVQDGRDGLPVDDRGGEVSRGLSSMCLEMRKLSLVDEELCLSRATTAETMMIR